VNAFFSARAWLGLLVLLVACARPAPLPQVTVLGAPPTGKLPAAVTPTAYRLELTILPDQERFSGRAEIAVELAAPAAFVWLHGRELNVAQVVAEAGSRRIAGRYS
jgi:hypothetical protein